MTREPADHLLQRICAWGEAQPDIRALVVTGSYARRRADALSDLDLEIFTHTPDRYLQSDRWMSEIGPVCVYLALDNDRGLPTRLIIFKDGSKVDFTVCTVAVLAGMVETRRLPALYERGFHVLVDKDQAASRLPQASLTPLMSQAPTEEELTQTIHEFWFEVYHVANYLQRNDLWAAKVRDWRLKELLLRMLEWYEKSLHGLDYDTGHDGTHISEWVEPNVCAQLRGVFAHFDVGDSREALQTTVDIFRDIAHDTAGRLRYHYPEAIERCLREYVASLGAHDKGQSAIMTPEDVGENKGLMRKMVRIFETGELSQVVAVIDTKYIDHQGLDGIVLKGPGGFSRVVTTARTAFPGLQVRIEDLIAEGDRVVARLKWHGTRPTGERIDRDTIEIVRFAGGRAIEHWGGVLG